MALRAKLILSALSFAVTTSAFAAPKFVLQPIQMGEESIRYNHGIATVDQFANGGSVQVRPAEMDHGSFAFNIAVFNDSTQSANIDLTNFTLVSNGVTAAAQTVEALEKKAKSRAAWSQFGLALAGGITAAAAASQRNTYHSTFRTPRGTYYSSFSAPSAIGQVQATAITAGTGVGIAAIQSRLDQTLDELGNDIIQLTTIDPGQSYAGKIIFEKVKVSALPMQVTVMVEWNGANYPFVFQVAKPGTPAPPFKPAKIIEPAAPVIDIKGLSPANELNQGL